MTHCDVRHLPRTCRLLVALAAAALGCSTASAQPSVQACGSLQASFGPYDYRTERGNNLYLVETAHFTPQIEALIGGTNTANVGADLDYTLRTFPNHVRALISVMKYAERTKSAQAPNMRYPVECYFERALRFRPDDTTVRMLYAGFLGKHGRSAEADAQLERVDAEAADNPFTHYNIGLIYLEAKKYDKALAQAHKAYGLGFGRPELREGLKAAGKWRDPAPSSSSGASAAASASGAEPRKKTD